MITQSCENECESSIKNCRFTDYLNPRCPIPKSVLINFIFSSQIQIATSEKIDGTYKELKRLSDIIKFTNDKTQKLQVEKAISDFQMIVQKYAKTEKSLTVKMRNTMLVDMAQQDDEAEQDDTEDMQQKLLHASFKFENELLIEREQNVNLIESNVLDVNEMMNNLSSLLTAQGESIQTIADVIEEGTSTVSSNHRFLSNCHLLIYFFLSQIAEGASELEKAASSQNKFRKKVVFLLIVAIIIALLVVFSIYSKLKK